MQIEHEEVKSKPSKHKFSYRMPEFQLSAVAPVVPPCSRTPIPVCQKSSVSMFLPSIACFAKKRYQMSSLWFSLGLLSMANHSPNKKISNPVVKTVDKTLAHTLPVLHACNFGLKPWGTVGILYSVGLYYGNKDKNEKLEISLRDDIGHATIHVMGSLCAAMDVLNDKMKNTAS